MEGRCAVETWAEFGFAAPNSLTLAFGTDVLLCTGSDEVYVFGCEERKLTTVLRFPGPVSDVVGSHDQQVLYVSCSSGVYYIDLHLLLARFPSSGASSGPDELKIPSEFLVVGEQGVSSLLHVGSVLLVLVQTDTSWLLSLYKTQRETPACKYEMLSSFSLPQLSHGDNGLKGRVTRRPVLVCVYSGDASPPCLSSASSTAPKQFHLEPALFRALFGIDAALVKSPIILCGLSDGRLCFLPLLLPGLHLRDLHHLEQPVVFVGASAVAKTGPGLAQCLVAVGERGRVVVIERDARGREGEHKAVRFSEGRVPGPVVCGCVDKHSLYYSTGSDLFVLELSDGSRACDDEDGNKETCRSAGALKSPTSLNVCRVIGLAGPVFGTAGEVELLGLTDRGRLLRMTLPDRASEVGGCHVVQDLPSAIGDVCERVSALEASIRSKKQLLGHLNQVFNVAVLLIANKTREDHLLPEEKAIGCHATLGWSRLLQKDSLNLTCILNNSSPYSLEENWTLSITVRPLSHSVSAGGESPSTTFSLPVHNLHPGETSSVSLPLAAAGDTSFPVTVHCSLIFSLAGLLKEEELLSSCISLPLNTLTVDWLHVLQLTCPTASHRTVASPSNSGMKDAIQAFLSSQRTGSSGQEGRKEEEQYSARVHVSLNLLRDAQVFKSAHLDLNHTSSLLDWLLFAEHGGVKMGNHRDGINLSSSVVCAQASNGDKIKLTAKEVSVGEECPEKEESRSTLEVEVEGKSIAAVCGLHHSVLSRLQTLMQQASKRSASTRGVHHIGLRLGRQQAVQRRISEAASTGRMSSFVIYQELKENPLLII